MIHHNDLHLAGYTRVLLRVFLRLLARDFKQNRALYIDNKFSALDSFVARLRSDGWVMVATSESLVRMAWRQGVKTADVLLWLGR